MTALRRTFFRAAKRRALFVPAALCIISNRAGRMGRFTSCRGRPPCSSPKNGGRFTAGYLQDTDIPFTQLKEN